MTTSARFVLFATFVSINCPAKAQGISSVPSTPQLSGYDSRGIGVPANSASTLLSFAVESDTTGDNAFDVATSDPGVIVSLILPSGTEVTSTTAAGLGYTLTIVPDTSPSDDLEPFSLPGTHTLIQIPGASRPVPIAYSIRKPL